ncbi:alpha/beta hydrolase [Methylobacillus flagellatus]|uniref:alpha/beta hydrolase n=1 Tax=Methylobacillus flagellatus TaxID=405 RepID=UPI0010F5D522|nr:alpha/beta hydrolase [Methylobacillus flagellatus]
MTVKKSLQRMLGVMAIAVTSGVGCSPVKTLNALIPDSAYQLSTVAYGTLPRQQLDVYVPKQRDPATPAPVVVFYYGGSWESGERADYKFVGEALSSQGFIVVIPDYRVYPDVLFPAFMQDPALAAKWVSTGIQQFGGDPARLFLAGHSAGAHIAVMLSVNPDYLAMVDMRTQQIRGTIGLAGPYDFLPLKTQRLNTIFGAAEEQWRSQPINFVGKSHPPMLLMVGMKDGTVWPRNSIRMAAKLKEQGNAVQLVEYADYGHIDMVARLAKPLRGDSTLLEEISRFVRAQP